MDISTFSQFSQEETGIQYIEKKHCGDLNPLKQ
jgi:hypothetical protein